ncbi:MAG: chemotaxis protein CheW [Thermodesulfovibrionales bacterium]|nr:chemotaxis protein CheW [Thermodesulfovibrionales bacterium]
MDIAKIRKKLKGLSDEQKAKGQEQKDLPQGELSSGAQKEDISFQRHEVSQAEERERAEQIQETSIEMTVAPETRPSELRAITQKTPDTIESPVMPEEEVQSWEAEPVNLLVFKLAGEEYAFMLEDVKEILKKQFITPVPLAPYSVIGITSLRGTVIPVIDLSMKLLGIHSRREKTSRILIMEGKEGTVGCLVDAIEGVLRSRDDQKKALPENMTDKERAFIDAIFVIDHRFITLLRKDVIEIPLIEARRQG